MIQSLKDSLKRILPPQIIESVRRARWPGRYIHVPANPTYNSDGLVTWHNTDFMRDPRFERAYASGERTGSWKGAAVHWRAFVNCWAAEHALKRSGEFVECGVNKGGYARTIVEYLDFGRTDRTYFLLDTFAGLSEKHITPEERDRGITPSMGGLYEGDCYTEVVETFRPFRNVEIIRGTVPETLSKVRADRVAYLSIDMNCVEPEIATLEFFWEKLSPGAVVVLDDYGWKDHILQKRAFDELGGRMGFRVLPLPTGQGLIFRS